MSTNHRHSPGLQAKLEGIPSSEIIYSLRKTNIPTQRQKLLDLINGPPSQYKYINEEFDSKLIYDELDIQTYRSAGDDFDLSVFLAEKDTYLLWCTLRKLYFALNGLKCENYVLYEWIESNLPQYTIEETKAFIENANRYKVAPRQNTNRTSSLKCSRQSSALLSLRFKSFLQSPHKLGRQIQINFKGKSTLADKFCLKLEKRVENLQTYIRNKVRDTHGQLLSIQYVLSETKELERNFLLHFTRDEDDRRFLEVATENQLKAALKKFMLCWYKSANHTISNVNIHNNAIRNQITKSKSELVNKRELKGLLKAVNYEFMLQQRRDYLCELHANLRYSAQLTSWVGHSMQQVSAQKRLMSTLENSHSQLLRRIRELSVTSQQIENELKKISTANELDTVRLAALKQIVDTYSAPSVMQYSKCRSKLVNVCKEEKYLMRRIGLCRMVLTQEKRKAARQ